MPRSSTAPLRSRDFRQLWLASMVSNVGSLLHAVAAAWLMLELTGSPFWVGLMTAAPTLPLLVLALPAGAVADSGDRRHILIIAQALMAAAAAATAGLWFAGLMTPLLLLVLGLLLGAGTAFNLPAWQAMVPDLVAPADVPGAVALNSASFNVARAVGPAMGGIIVAAAGPGAAFLANAVSFGAVMVALVALRVRRRPADPEPMSTAIASGLRYARFTPSYRWILVTASCFALTSAGLQALLPSFTADVLGGGAAVYGLLLGAMGVGALGGAFSRGRAEARLGEAMVPASIAVFGLLGAGVAMARNPFAAAAGMVLAGVLWVWILSTLNATTQMLSPAWVRGRIMSLYTLSFVGLIPVGSVLAGALGEVFGTVPALAGLSLAASALGVAAFWAPLPRLGDIETPRPVHDAQPADHAVSVEGDPVMITTTYVIDEADLGAFLDVAEQLRLVRLRTGAFRWRLYRNVGDAHRMTEVYLLNSWEAHLRQHRRIDTQAAEVIDRARGFDRAGGPVVRHLAAIDVTDRKHRPGWEALVAVHEQLHRPETAVDAASRP